jgi:KaiC/GvpD/RAD55 family RecA-like ATPase
MGFAFEGFDFELPAFTLLSGPMAAAKPLFAQKFIVRFLKEHPDYSVLYFATSSPVCGILRNLRVFGIGSGEIQRITFLDYQPSCEGLKRVDSNYYIGNFSEPEQLRNGLDMAGQKSVVVIPSFTLLLIGSEEKGRLVEVLIDGLEKAGATAFVAVNSAMFEEHNRKLAENADNVLEFLKRGEKVYVKALKFKGRAPEGEVPFEFPREMFEGTKKEVAERTARIIREKKVGR